MKNLTKDQDLAKFKEWTDCGDPRGEQEAFIAGAVYGRAHVLLLVRQNARNQSAPSIRSFLLALADLLQEGTIGS